MSILGIRLSDSDRAAVSHDTINDSYRTSDRGWMGMLHSAYWRLFSLWHFHEFRQDLEPRGACADARS